MTKPHSLDIGDKVAIVSLSSGALGESFAAHELELGKQRLQDLGLEPVIMPNATKGIKYLGEHPEARAADLVAAFADPEIKGIICAIGGRDGYKVLPHILGDKNACQIIKNNPKVFLGYSDSTTHHLMLSKLGLNTFYGQAFLTDLAELDSDMLPYSKFWFLNLFIGQKNIELSPSEVWYHERTDFSPKAMGTSRQMELENLGFVSLCKGGKATGELFGGCIDVIYNALSPEFEDEKQIFAKFDIIPQNNAQKILFLETSDEKVSPQKFRKMLSALKNRKFFDGAAGVLFGKPQDEVHMQEYMQIVREELANHKVLLNLNFGHAFPHCIMPYGVKVVADFDNCTVQFVDSWFND